MPGRGRTPGNMGLELAKRSTSDPDDDTGKSRDRLFVTALARGLGILRCFSRRTPELGTSEIARATGLPQPTVWRLCHTLVQLGFLVHVPGSDKLRLGVPVLALGHAVLSTYSVGELGRPYMQDIADRYQGQVSIGARDGHSMVYLQRCTATAVVLADLSVGSLVPIAYSATGWAYIAGMDPRERAALFAEMEAKGSDRWRETRPKLEAAIIESQETGFIKSFGVLHPDINAAAAPIRSEDGSTLLSISSGGLSRKFDAEALDRLGPELVALAGKLSVALSTGGRPVQRGVGI